MVFKQTATWLAQLEEGWSVEQEIADLTLGQTNTQDL